MKAQWVTGGDAVIRQVREGEPNEEKGQMKKKGKKDDKKGPKKGK